LAITTFLAAAIAASACPKTVTAGPTAAIEPHSTEFLRRAASVVEKTTETSVATAEVPNSHTLREGSLVAVEETVHHQAELFVNLFSASGLFDSPELEPNLADDRYKPNSDRGACVYSDSYLRTLGGGTDDCGVLKPGEDEPAVFTLPFLALSGWAFVILAVAGLHYVRGQWRVRRWRRRMLVQGIAIGAPKRRGTAGTTARRSTSRGRPHAQRQYAGRSDTVSAYTTEK
jgi:hypothetical protein